MPVTEQVPYSKQTTEALGSLAGEPVKKRLALAREEYVPGNWQKRANKILTERWKANDFWKMINVNK